MLSILPVKMLQGIFTIFLISSKKTWARYSFRHAPFDDWSDNRWDRLIWKISGTLNLCFYEKTSHAASLVWPAQALWLWRKETTMNNTNQSARPLANGYCFQTAWNLPFSGFVQADQCRIDQNLPTPRNIFKKRTIIRYNSIFPFFRSCFIKIFSVLYRFPFHVGVFDAKVRETLCF